MLLTDAKIRDAISVGELAIENFAEGCLQPASYDMRLGEQAITSTHREKINPATRGLLIIPAGDFALVTTHERVKMSSKMAGHIGLRSYFARKGLVVLSGPQIDPGFEGVLVIGLCNLSPSDVVLPYKERFCTVEFYGLREQVASAYQGEYQRQEGISGRDLGLLVEAQGMTFGQVITALNALSADVKAISSSISMLKWVIPVIIAIGMAIVGIIAALT